MESRFQFVNTVSHDLEATYTKVNLTVLNLTFGR